MPTNSNLISIAAEIANVPTCPLQCQPLIPKAIVANRVIAIGLCFGKQFSTRKEAKEVETISGEDDDALAGGG